MTSSLLSFLRLSHGGTRPGHCFPGYRGDYTIGVDLGKLARGAWCSDGSFVVPDGARSSGSRSSAREWIADRRGRAGAGPGSGVGSASCGEAILFLTAPCIFSEKQYPPPCSPVGPLKGRRRARARMSWSWVSTVWQAQRSRSKRRSRAGGVRRVGR